jgi:hypothetical protein
VPSSSGVVDAGRIDRANVEAGRVEPAPDSERTTVGLPFEASEAPLSSVVDGPPTTEELLPGGSIPSFVSSGDIGEVARRGGTGSRFAFVQVVLVTIVVALALIALRFAPF